MDEESSWKKLWIRFSWVTHPVWHPIYRAFDAIWDFIYWSVWDSFKDWVGDAVDWVKDGSSNLAEKLRSLTRKKETGSDDEESQEAQDGAASRGNEKQVQVEVDDAPPE